MTKVRIFSPSTALKILACFLPQQQEASQVATKTSGRKKRSQANASLRSPATNGPPSWEPPSSDASPSKQKAALPV